MISLSIEKRVNSDNFHLLSIAVETSSYCIRNCDQQEIRHDHYGFHWCQHVDHDTGSLRPGQNVEFCSGQPQLGLYSHFLHRVHFEDILTQAVLFQGAVECL